jgi:hypothetical protein
MDVTPGSGKTTPITPVPACVLCGGPVERWPGGGGAGNNPQPLADAGRCCNNCNRTRVIPARLGGAR